MSAKILNALLQLDVGNDDHWTSDGLPRMDVIEGIVGDKAITRQQVTAARPGFSRAVAAQAVQPQQATQAPAAPAAQPAQPAQPAHPADPAVQVHAEPASEPDTEVATGEELNEVAQLRAKLAAAQEEMESLDVQRIQLTKKHQAVAQEVDKLTAKLQTLVGVETVTNAIQSYLAKQRDQLAKRAELLQSAPVQTRSALDAAMARKTGFGLNRPGG